jgi:hypothetical protein
MNPFTEHIFITVNFAGKCLFMGAIFNFEDKVGSGHQDDG